MLAADADGEIGAGGAAALDGDTDQLADAAPGDRLERGDREDAQPEIAAEERSFHVVAGEPPRHLGQVVGAEGEELGGAGDLARGERRPGYLDHRADPDPRSPRHAGQHFLGLGAYRLELLN